MSWIRRSFRSREPSSAVAGTARTFQPRSPKTRLSGESSASTSPRVIARPTGSAAGCSGRFIRGTSSTSSRRFARSGPVSVFARAFASFRLPRPCRSPRGFWLGSLGLGANCYEQRLPDAIWTAAAAYQRALLAGMWRGDGSWSFVNGGPSVILEYGTVSRELADGLLRLLTVL